MHLGVDRLGHGDTGGAGVVVGTQAHAPVVGSLALRGQQLAVLGKPAWCARSCRSWGSRTTGSCSSCSSYRLASGAGGRWKKNGSPTTALSAGYSSSGCSGRCRRNCQGSSCQSLATPSALTGVSCQKYWSLLQGLRRGAPGAHDALDDRGVQEVAVRAHLQSCRWWRLAPGASPAPYILRTLRCATAGD